MPKLRKSSEPDVSTSEKVLYFIELLCEGHNHHSQNFLREQSGSRTQVGYLVTAAHCHLLATCYPRISSYLLNSLSTAHCPLFTTHHHYSLLTTHYSLLTTHHSPLTTHHSLHTTHCSPLTAHYSLLTVHCTRLYLLLAAY